MLLYMIVSKHTNEFMPALSCSIWIDRNSTKDGKIYVAQADEVNRPRCRESINKNVIWIANIIRHYIRNGNPNPRCYAPSMSSNPLSAVMNNIVKDVLTQNITSQTFNGTGREEADNTIYRTIQKHICVKIINPAIGQHTTEDIYGFMFKKIQKLL